MSKGKGKALRRADERIAKQAPTLDDARHRKGQWLALPTGVEAMLELVDGGWHLSFRRADEEAIAEVIDFGFCTRTRQGATGAGWPGSQLLVHIRDNGEAHYRRLAQRSGRRHRGVRLTHYSLW